MPDDARSRSGPRRRPVDAPRLAALEVLLAVRHDDAYTNLVLPAVLRRRGLAGRDAAFVTELASGTLRRRGTYDAVLTACIDRPLRRVDPGVLDALRLGCHQLLAMRVPSHAAISTTVDLVHERSGRGAAGFVNAVLRSVDRRDLAGWVDEVAPSAADDPLGHAEVATSHPRWIVDELRKASGADDLAAVLAADNEPPRVTLVARPGRADRDELPGTPTRWSPVGSVLDGGQPSDVPAVAEGRAGVQDEGSQLVALALAGAPVEGRDEHWVDLCAGPGGKAALLAGLAAERGARLLAVEKQPHRARLVARSLGVPEPADGETGVVGADAAPGVAGVLVADGTEPPLPPGSADRVLLDAPCTGLGALRRRPEARWRRRPEDLVALVLLQRRLLAAALGLVRPGGVVLYATCSPVLAETSDVVGSVLRQRTDVGLLDVRAALPPAPWADGDPASDVSAALEGCVQLWPHRHGTDAMFMALLRRT